MSNNIALEGPEPLTLWVLEADLGVYIQIERKTVGAIK